MESLKSWAKDPSPTDFGLGLIDAAKDPTYIMLFLGFFSCGFQLAFITAHFPAFIAEASSPIIQGSLISFVCNSVTSLGALSIAVPEYLYRHPVALKELIASISLFGFSDAPF